MADDLNVGIRLKADATGVAPGVKTAQAELGKLNTTAGTASRGLDQAAKASERTGRAQIELSGATRQSAEQLGRLNQSAQTAARGINQSAEAARQAKQPLNTTAAAAEQLGTTFKRAGALAAGAFVGVSFAQMAQGLVQTADQMRQLEGRLRLVVEGAKELAQAQQELFRIAQRNMAPLSETVTLYTRLATAMEGSGRSQREVLALTEAVGQGLRISGASAAEAGAAMLQFSQAMASGVLRGDEFNSMMESAPRLMRAIADGMQVNVGALRAMATEGELTAERVTAALESQYEVLKRQSAQLPMTVGGAFGLLRNEVQRYIGEVDKASGASTALAGTVKIAADNVDDLGAAIGKLAQGALFIGGGALALRTAAAVAKLGAMLKAAATAAAALNTATVMFASGAALSRLTTIATKYKGGLLGAVLWGGYEIGSIVRKHTEGIESVNHALDAFFDRARQLAGLDTVADRAVAAADAGYAINAKATAQRQIADNAYRQSLILPESQRARTAPNFTTDLSTEGFELRQKRAQELAKEQAAAAKESLKILDDAESHSRETMKKIEADRRKMEKALSELQTQGAAEQAKHLEQLRKKRAETLDSAVEKHRQAMRTEIEVEQERHAQVLRDFTAALDSKRLTEADYRTLRERAESYHQESLRDIQERSQREAQRALEREQERQREIMMQPFENAIRGIQTAFADGFENILSGGVRTFSDLASEIKRIFIRLASEVIALRLFQPFAGSLLGMAGAGSAAAQLGLSTGMTSTTGATAGALGAAINPMQTILSLLSTPGLGIKATDLAARLGFGNTGQMIAGNIGANFGYGLAGVGAANLFGLGGGTAANALGTVGGLAGSAFGPIGGAVGGFLGTALGGLFGGKPSRETEIARIASKGGYFNTSNVVGGGSGVIGQLADTINQQVNEELKRRGVVLQGGHNFQIREVANYDKVGDERFHAFASSFIPGVQAGNNAMNIEATDPAQFVQQVVQAILANATTRKDPTVIRVERDTLNAQRNQALALLASLDSTKRFTTQIDAVITQFGELRLNAKEFGLSLAAINRVERSQLTTLRGSYEDQVRGLVNQGQGILGLDRLAAFGDSLRYGEFAQGTPATRLTSARGELDRIAKAALAGDVDAINQFPELASSVLQFGRDTYASGPEYQSVLASVTQTYESVLRRQRELEASLTSGISVTIRESAAEQIAAIREQTKLLEAALKQIDQRLRRVTA